MSIKIGEATKTDVTSSIELRIDDREGPFFYSLEKSCYCDKSADHSDQ